MRRFRDTSGFTLIELGVVLLVLAVLVAVAVPTFIGFSSTSETAAAKSNVSSAIPAAEEMSGSTGKYTGITGATLRSTAPGIGTHVKAVAVNSSKGYCIQDTENSGATYYNYVGGTPGSALQPGYKQATIQSGTCFQAVGLAAS